MTPWPAVDRPRRSRPVTVLAVLVMLGSVLLLPISLISALMLLAGSHGTEHATLGGGLLVVLGPALTLVAGFGLWWRWRWAWGCLLLVLLAVLVTQFAGWWQGPTPARSEVSPSGVLVTVSGSPARYSLPLIGVCVGLAAFLLRPGVRAEFRYGSPALAAPTPSPPPGQPASPAAPAPRAAPRSPGAGRTMQGMVVTGLLLAAAFMAWLVWQGLDSGMTWWPARSGVARHVVARAADPAKFWTALGLYATLGCGALGLLGWGFWAALNPSKGTRPH